MFVLETRVIMWQRRFGVQGFAPETKFYKISHKLFFLQSFIQIL